MSLSNNFEPSHLDDPRNPADNEVSNEAGKQIEVSPAHGEAYSLPGHEHTLPHEAPELPEQLAQFTIVVAPSAIPLYSSEASPSGGDSTQPAPNVSSEAKTGGQDDPQHPRPADSGDTGVQR